jgi:UPF0755 protein
MVKKIIILLILVLIIGQIIYARGINSSVEKNGQDKIFVVEKGESVKKIGSNLLEADLIKSKFYFEVYIWRNELEKDLQAGEYVLSPKLSIKEIVRVLSEGEALNDELTIKVIEGWKIDDIDTYLQNMGIVKEGEFSKLVELRKQDWTMSFIDEEPKFLSDAPLSANLEGYLFPDTYRIYKDASAEDIIFKMLDNFGRKINEQMREDIKKQGRTIYETVIMASLVEKEVRTREDMKIVSGIFWDRIRNGQALESCATLAYILGENKPQYSTEDTKIDSPYNTYQNRGLPPSPISNPGLNAISAAIYPEYTEYNYFLSKSDTGETVFSRTYDEHLRNKAKYLK